MSLSVGANDDGSDNGSLPMISNCDVIVLRLGTVSASWESVAILPWNREVGGDLRAGIVDGLGH